jgi:hypothetical protein
VQVNQHNVNNAMDRYELLAKMEILYHLYMQNNSRTKNKKYILRMTQFYNDLNNRMI